MEAQTRETAVVVADLFTKMECTVDAYGPGAIKVARRVEGTAFFPGGVGLWRTLEPWGVAPLLFPRSPLSLKFWLCFISTFNHMSSINKLHIYRHLCHT